MVFFLILNVFDHGLNALHPDAEYSVAPLPFKRLKMRPLFLQPLV